MRNSCCDNDLNYNCGCCRMCCRRSHMFWRYPQEDSTCRRFEIERRSGIREERETERITIDITVQGTAATIETAVTEAVNKEEPSTEAAAD